MDWRKRTPKPKPKPKPKPPCRFFAQHGRCRFGTECRFSHDSSSSQAGSSQARAHPDNRRETLPPAGDRLREWKQLLKSNSSNWRPSRSSAFMSSQSCDQFFKLALELMEGDIGASQETVKLMAQEAGLDFIKNLIDRQIPEARDEPTKARLWLNQIRPMFLVLTHPRVVDSNVLEQQVATIYNFIQGIGSRRMKTLFDFVLGLLESCSTMLVAEEDADGLSACELSLSILAAIVDCNTSNIVNDIFNQIIEQFGNRVRATSDSPDNFSKLQAEKYLQYLERRLGVGGALDEAETGHQVSVTRAEFIMRKDMPGQLSADGPRHDNDHDDFRKIKILPTYEEITSIRNEYLPTTDSALFHRPGIHGRLDREFRLLREDTVGQLRDAIATQLDAMRNPQRKQGRGNKNSARTYAYDQVSVVNLGFGRNKGMELLVEFSQPTSKKTPQQRRDWWEHSKRLQPGGLVCIFSERQDVLFGVVSESTIVTEGPKGNTPDDEESSKKPSLADNENFAYVYLHLAEACSRDIGQTLRWFQSIGYYKQQRCLVEFPRVLLPSFQHTLMALQRMSAKSNVPFDDLLAPAEQKLELDTKVVGAPHYTTKPGFSFDLSCLTNDGVPLDHSPRAPLNPQVLSTHSSLDMTQSSALLNALSRRMALIQGPPGTGKSYTGEKIIKVLLANKRRASLGPILCVCYTNHALDQLLVHLKRDNVKIIRIGSRSKAEELDGLNLRVVAQAAERTKSENGSLRDLRSKRDDDVRSITRSIADLASCQDPKKLRDYLYVSHPQHYDALFSIEDDEGFRKQYHPSPGQLFTQWRNSGKQDGSTPRDIDDLVNSDLWAMTNAERSRIYNFWIRSIRDPFIDDIIREHRSYQYTNDALSKVSRDLDLRCLHESDVVGATTTGLARNIELLQKLRCKVMLCEEAGEVLEAHALTALLPSVEHAILIGDHQQLRPQIVNYDLQSTSHRGAQYSLDISLFERLINPEYDTDPRLPFDTLETQRRMHPNISELIRSTLYPSLEDGGVVAKYPEIYGMKKRLFWLHHESPEDRAIRLDPTTTSHTNTFEVEMTVALVQHLVRQGSYGADDIAVITPYLGQLHRLRRQMGGLFEISVGERDLDELEALEADKSTHDNTVAQPQKPLAVKRTLLKSIRLATVDNFQGEEAKVVVISLVRSNDENKCGFLSTSNRINVLLSRAQHGMYLIGNANTYRHVSMWAKVLGILEKNGDIGKELELQCPRHPDPKEPLLVSKADDFLRVAPEGGCILRCDQRLPCGHSCINRCHHENLHNAVKCLEPCPRLKKGCQHPCRLSCGDACKLKCDEYLKGLCITLACGHTISEARCWEAQDPSSIVCNQMVKKEVPGCGHMVEVSCHIDVGADLYRCGKICLDPHPCGHSCKRLCCRCKVRKGGEIITTDHGMCVQECGRQYTTCRHKCRKPCHGDTACPLCPASCEVRCSHSKCSRKCHEPCAPCAEQTCSSSCPHSQCTMPCAAPCDWVPCSKRCEKTLGCGHQCPSICGEACPDEKFCQTCCSQDIKKIRTDFIMFTEYQEVDLNEDPCLFLDCGHIVTKTNMDSIMDMNAHYKMSAEENPTAIRNASNPFEIDEVKTCPDCRGSLRNIARYGRIVRRAMLDEATKKFVAWSQMEYARLATSLLDVRERISETPVSPEGPRQTTQSDKIVKLTIGRAKQIQLIQDWLGGNRYEEAIKLWRRLNGFIGNVRREEQPLQKVNDFVQYAIQERRLQGTFAFDETKIQHGALFQACSLWLKCDIIIISDFMVQWERLRSSRNKLELELSQHIKDCDALAEGARMAKHPRQEAEAYIYYAQFCAFSRAFSLYNENSNGESMDTLKEQASERLALARNLVEEYQGQTRGLSAEIEAAEKMIRDDVFYEAVSADELRDVYKAMAREFLGTGHWYNCENGHPFTIGECGMPMEQAICPECGAAVGGVNHTSVEGVQRADDIENLARGIGGMGIH
ncbi:uncharacterized protein GGS22DRAFT_75682 [Annulohypoxylon maeteangense]|uniref:uncharacterized protein n=1 Tax=Annulohypoxylon maeteangense TaxID=1927788 RepID=UPI00200804C9|nr:uncharacterized protein GGS22DRAFT_75682 [Annulohypoxylon maeteangense]KAI0881097.1 hypothetical protein GGS22DRAFT_75682 [Annulohypoxylon maeteangense]